MREQSKRTIKFRQILGVTLFTSAIAFYLLLQSFHPFLHNHHVDGKNHHNCPVCAFLSTASLVDIPDAYVTINQDILPKITYQICIEFNNTYRQNFSQNCLIRGPPSLSTT
jgi:hypothetical protein